MEAWKWMRFPSSASHFWKRGPLFQVANLRFFGGWTGTHGPTGVWLHTCSRNHVEFHFPTVFVLGSGRGRVADFPGKDVHYHPDTKWRVKTRKKIKWIQMISFKYIYIYTQSSGETLPYSRNRHVTKNAIGIYLRICLRWKKPLIQPFNPLTQLISRSNWVGLENLFQLGRCWSQMNHKVRWWCTGKWLKVVWRIGWNFEGWKEKMPLKTLEVGEWLIKIDMAQLGADFCLDINKRSRRGANHHGFGTWKLQVYGMIWGL